MAETVFGSDRPLLYNVDPWNEMGYAVPNWGTVVGTRNTMIWGLADYIGQAQLFVMTHEDVMRTQPPSVNTVQRLGKICNRASDVVQGRAKEDKDVRLESGHATADVQPWNVHPVPYHRSAFLRNHWLGEYNRLTMILLTNMYQHSDNNVPLTITAKFANDVLPYVNEIKMLVGAELLGLDRQQLADTAFRFDDASYAAYAPSSFTLNMERLDSPGPLQSMPTETDHRPLFEGIPSVLLLNLVAQYPVGPGGEGWSGTPVQPNAAAPGTTDGSAIAPPGSHLGVPQI